MTPSDQSNSYSSEPGSFHSPQHAWIAGMVAGTLLRELGAMPGASVELCSRPNGDHVPWVLVTVGGRRFEVRTEPDE